MPITSLLLIRRKCGAQTGWRSSDGAEERVEEKLVSVGPAEAGGDGAGWAFRVEELHLLLS